MKKNAKLTLISALAFFSLIIFGCYKQNAPWKGTIEIRDGIKIVNNPASPIYASPQFALSEELSIGGIEKGDNGLFFQNILPYNSIDIDVLGNIYIVDEKACQIKVVNDKGRYIKKFGRPGQGPGEFQAPSCIKVLSDGNIAVYDSINRRICYFSLTGKIIKKLNLAVHPELYTPQIGEDGKIVGVTLDLGPNRTLGVIKISADGKTATKIGTFNTRPVFDGKTIDLFVPSMEFKISPRNEITWGVQNKFTLNISTQAGLLKEQIINKFRPVPISAKDVEARVKAVFRGRGIPANVKIESPAHYQPFNTILLSDEGWIFVQTNEKTNDGINLFDVFDESGRFHSKIPIKGNPILIRKQKMYSIEENKDGVIFVKRYKMTPLNTNALTVQ